MKFELDNKVVFNGNNAIVWDYSIGFKEYDIKLENGIVIITVYKKAT